MPNAPWIMFHHMLQRTAVFFSSDFPASWRRSDLETRFWITSGYSPAAFYGIKPHMCLLFVLYLWTLLAASDQKLLHVALGTVSIVLLWTLWPQLII